jgi:hypothetical protein
VEGAGGWAGRGSRLVFRIWQVAGETAGILSLKSFENVVDDAFDQLDLVIVQHVKLSLPPFLGERPVILPDVQDQVFRHPIRHLDRLRISADPASETLAVGRQR